MTETRLNKVLPAVNCERLPMREMKELSQDRCEAIAKVIKRERVQLAFYETPLNGVFGIAQWDASQWVN